MDSALSDSARGAKPLLLKIVDPFFKKRRGGSEVPVKITGEYIIRLLVSTSAENMVRKQNILLGSPATLSIGDTHEIEKKNPPTHSGSAILWRYEYPCAPSQPSFVKSLCSN
jgi:hypothetical protein